MLLSINNCRKCNVELTLDNISISCIKHKNYICKKCTKLYNAAYRNKNKIELKRTKKEYYLKNRERLLKKGEEYRFNNKIIINNREKIYYGNHLEFYKKYRKDYYSKNRYELSLKTKENYIKNKEYYLEYARQYRKSFAGKCADKRHALKRERNLGYNPLNQPFLNSSGHHINNKDVIYIPTETHVSVRHNLMKYKNMDVINSIAIFFLLQQNILELSHYFMVGVL